MEIEPTSKPRGFNYLETMEKAEFMARNYKQWAVTCSKALSRGYVGGCDIFHAKVETKELVTQSKTK
jgi:glutaredoxin-related protein